MRLRHIRETIPLGVVYEWNRSDTFQAQRTPIDVVVHVCGFRNRPFSALHGLVTMERCSPLNRSTHGPVLAHFEPLSLQKKVLRGTFFILT